MRNLLPKGQNAQTLENILECVRILSDPVDKMQWIDRGALHAVLAHSCQNGQHNLNNSTSIQILKHLIGGNVEGSQVCWKLLSDHFNKHIDCLGIIDIIQNLISVHPFKSVFLQHCGVSKILERLHQISVNYFGKQSIALCCSKGIANQNDETEDSNETSGEEKEDFDSSLIERMDDLDLPLVNDDAEFNDALNSLYASDLNPQNASKPFIPRLNIPSRRETTTPKLTRSSRRLEDDTLRRKNSSEFEVKQSASQELTWLATKLGETFMSADLTALISFKQQDKSLSTVSFYALPGLDQTMKEPPTGTLRNPAQHKVRCQLLKILEAIYDDFEKLDELPDVTNLLFTELLHTFSDKYSTTEEYRRIILNILSQHALSVEKTYVRDWEEVTSGLNCFEKKAFVKRNDKLLWRINSRLTAFYDIQKRMDNNLNSVLSSLRSYLRHCPSSTMSFQAIEVCLENLVRIKQLCFNKGKFGIETLGYAQTISTILEALDEIALQNKSSQINDFFIKFFLESTDNFKYFKHYIGTILLDEKIESKIVATYPVDGKLVLRNLRIHVIKHYEVCLQLLKTRLGELSEDAVPEIMYVVNLLKSFEFLISPSGGFLFQFLSSENPYENFAVKKEILVFCQKIFAIPKSPFVKKKKIIDAYVGYHYITFIKLYCNFALDIPTLELCRLHLQVLLSFASNKNDKVMMKFYQLKVMEFLVREFNLEFEAKMKREREKSLQESKDIKVLRSSNNNLTVSIPTQKKSESTTSSPSNADLESKPKLQLSLGSTLTLGNQKKKIPSLSLDASLTKGEGGTQTVFQDPPSKKVPFLKIAAPKGSGTSLSDSMDGIKVESLNNSPGTGNSLAQLEISTKPKLKVPQLTLAGIRKTDQAQKDPPANSNPNNATNIVNNNSPAHIPPLVPPNNNLVPPLNFGNGHLNSTNHGPQSLGAGLQNSGMLQNGSFSKARRTSLSADITDGFYQAERGKRKLYHDKELHVSALLLIFNLLLTPNNTLSDLYCDQFPLVNRKLNIPFLLHLHINHPKNAYILPMITQQIRQAHNRSCYVLFQLLCIQLFQPSVYTSLNRIGAGAYGTVFKALVNNNEKMPVAIKLLQLPQSIHDRCALYDIFTEVTIMDKFKNDPRSCILSDFGVDHENYWIVMKLCKANLKEWRLKQTKPLAENLPLYLNVFSSVLNTVMFLSDNKVNHYDLKCENILMDPLFPDTSDENFWNQPSTIPNFSLCLADFGVSKIYNAEREGFTTRNRGTECIKSPEMLLIAYTSEKTNIKYDRRKPVGANTASDVWSLGCMLFELLTGKFLFDADDFARFFTMLTVPEAELIPKDRRVLLNSEAPLLEFLEFVLVRNPVFRPTIQDVTQRFAAIRSAYLGKDCYCRTPSAVKHEESLGHTQAWNPVKLAPLGVNFDEISLIFQNKPIMISSELDFDMIGPESLSYVEVADQLVVAHKSVVNDRILLKNKLQITHVVNCSENKFLLASYFQVMEVDKAFSAPDAVQKVTLFMKNAIMHHGKVLIFAEKHISRAATFAIAYLMMSKTISLYDAFLFVKERIYTLKSNLVFTDQLLRWHNELTSNQRKPTEVYQCLCGACTFSLLLPFESSEIHQNPRACACKVEEPSDCPNMFGCATFLEDMKKRFHYPEDYLMWGYTFFSNVVRGYEYRTTQCQGSLLRGKHVKKDNWKLYKCRTCGFLTHAIYTKNLRNKSKPMAIVANFKVQHTK